MWTKLRESYSTKHLVSLNCRGTATLNHFMWIFNVSRWTSRWSLSSVIHKYLYLCREQQALDNNWRYLLRVHGSFPEGRRVWLRDRHHLPTTSRVWIDRPLGPQELLETVVGNSQCKFYLERFSTPETKSYIYKSGKISAETDPLCQVQMMEYLVLRQVSFGSCTGELFEQKHEVNCFKCVFS